MIAQMIREKGWCKFKKGSKAGICVDPMVRARTRLLLEENIWGLALRAMNDNPMTCD
jgi:hypothetical protein